MPEENYKQTLNLPKTTFPMKANLAQREPQTLDNWAKIDLYQQIQKQNTGKPTFTLTDGPLYANGNIHIGHALNRILKDIILKSKLLSGFDAMLVPGWDCHGLPIEHQVEKKVGKPGQKITASDFRARCRDYVKKQIANQKTAFMRLGILADWQHPYQTMAPQYEAHIIRSLARIIENGHLVRGNKPVHWCLACASALAEAEVEYRDKTSPAIDVAFKVIDSDLDALVDKPACVVIWTTTPWTLPANEAVCVHADLEYVLVRCQFESEQRFFIVAKTLLESFVARCDISKHDIIETFLGQTLEKTTLKHPFYAKTVPMVLGDHVTVETGTGCVHTAPAHGVEDHLVGQRYQLPMDNPVGSNGCFVSTVESLAGIHVSKANEKILELLKTHQTLLHHETVEHSYPHCWRHKTPLIFRATPQWFISMSEKGLQKKALECTQQVTWHPARGQDRFESMLRERPDWCISRQRTWGVPMALFLHKETCEMHPDTIALMSTIAEQVEQAGLEAWYDLDPKTVLGDQAKEYEKSQDTLDVWFDSGVVHSYAQAHKANLETPADLYLEGSDQHRGWFQSSMLTSIAMNHQAPYQSVITHGFTIDANGHKMSKSLGNVIDPADVIKTLGADVLRLWVASADYHQDMRVSDEILKRMSDAYRRIRNTARFLLGNLAGFDPSQHLVAPEDLIALDQYIVACAFSLQQTIQQAYQDYQFHIIYQKIHNFCVVDLGNFYLDVIKDRQYTCAPESLPRRSAQTALYHVANALVRWLAPILSFTAEEIWAALPGESSESVFLSTWYTELFDYLDQSELDHAFWEQIRVIRDEVNKALEVARKAQIIGSPLEAQVTLFADQKHQALLEKLKDELRFVLIVSQVFIKPNTKPGLEVIVDKSIAEKCVRCWHRLPDVNADPKYPSICSRCIQNVTTTGETRIYA